MDEASTGQRLDGRERLDGSGHRPTTRDLIDSGAPDLTGASDGHGSSTERSCPRQRGEVGAGPKRGNGSESDQQKDGAEDE